MQEGSHRLCIVLTYTGEIKLSNDLRAAIRGHLSSQFRPTAIWRQRFTEIVDGRSM